MRPRDDVYAQIVPDPRPGPRQALVRVLLPYGPTTEAADVRSSWPRVQTRLRQALRHARANEASILPAGLLDCLAVELTVPMIFVMAVDIGVLYGVVEPDIQRMIIAAIKGRDRAARP